MFREAKRTWEQFLIDCVMVTELSELGFSLVLSCNSARLSALKPEEHNQSNTYAFHNRQV